MEIVPELAGKRFEDEDFRTSNLISIENITGLDMDDAVVDLIGITRVELRTIIFGLQAYRDNLSQDATKSDEDGMFCYGEMQKVSKLLFEIQDDHTSSKKAWMDIYIAM